MSEFTEDQIAAFRDAFELFDRTGAGTIAYKECSSLARCFGYSPTDAFVKNLLSGGDGITELENELSNKDMEEKMITLDEFLPHLWNISQAPDPGNYEDFYEGLKVFDKNGQGLVSSAELRHVLTSLGEKMTAQEVEKLCEGLENNDGEVNYDIFIKTLMSDKEGIWTPEE
ncbi:Oidioi.mRNA.OKI2018_I69.chr2.g5450.t1.cds [Oikopleura dioica]|uniref:Oidioi.mRNA.OKI2018_I69.chr2.g5450.t1.cds n=1 Tax=Oikopleura dioica TaxID=34765 RepID=A0ABN7T3Q0_OIKDI|nr:Oidioi.mRNA.OKI2018_I69.chr2.g5450.t1.cds [Oikopleura dioica]